MLTGDNRNDRACPRCGNRLDRAGGADATSGDDGVRRLDVDFMRCYSCGYGAIHSNL